MRIHNWEQRHGYKKILKHKEQAFREQMRTRSKEEILDRWERSDRVNEIGSIITVLCFYILLIGALIGGIHVGKEHWKYHSDNFQATANAIAEKYCIDEDYGDYINAELYTDKVVVYCENKNVVITGVSTDEN